MADKNVRVHRLVSNITSAPTGSDAQLDSVSRKMSKYFADGATAIYDSGSGTATGTVPDDSTSIKNYLNTDFPGATVAANTVWVWIINEITGQRQLFCYDGEVMLTQEKKADGTTVAINPAIGVRVEKLMTIMSASSTWP